MPREQILAYQTHSTYGETHALALSYADAINQALKDDTLHPGLYADYGVTLALMGHSQEASRMLNNEMRAFPESRGLVMRVKQHLIPQFVGDTLSALGDTIDTRQLMRWAYDSLSALMPLPAVASVIDSSDREWITRQTPADSVEYPVRLTANQKRELLFQQQTESERLRKAKEDSVATAKQQKIDARKQQKIEKEKAKKAKEKEKKKAEKEKKQLQKQKQKERRQQAAEKERQRKQSLAEKEKQRKQAVAAKKTQDKNKSSKGGGK